MLTVPLQLTFSFLEFLPHLIQLLFYVILFSLWYLPYFYEVIISCISSNVAKKSPKKRNSISCSRSLSKVIFPLCFHDNHCSKFLHYDCCHCWGSYSLCFVVFSSWNKRRYIKAHYLPEDLKDECFLTSLPSGQFLFSKVQLPTSWMVTSKINSTFQQALFTVAPWGWNGILFTFLLDSWWIQQLLYM